MKRYSHVTSVWYRAFWELRVYVGQFIDDDWIATITARAWGYWVQAALDGVETVNGPYRLLFTMAEQRIQETDPMGMLGTSQKLLDAVPLDTGRMSCDLARLWSALWQAGALCEWDRATRHKVAKRVGRMVPTDTDEWYELEVPPIDDPVARLARRAFEVMYEHDCTDNEICTRASDIWAREDQVSDRWMETERLAREGI